MVENPSLVVPTGTMTGEGFSACKGRIMFGWLKNLFGGGQAPKTQRPVQTRTVAQRGQPAVRRPSNMGVSHRPKSSSGAPQSGQGGQRQQGRGASNRPLTWGEVQTQGGGGLGSIISGTMREQHRDQNDPVLRRIREEAKEAGLDTTRPDFIKPEEKDADQAIAHRSGELTEERAKGRSKEDIIAHRFNFVLQEAAKKDQEGGQLTAEQQEQFRKDMQQVFGKDVGDTQMGAHTARLLAELGVSDSNSTIDDYVHGREGISESDLENIKRKDYSSERNDEVRNRLAGIEEALSSASMFLAENGFDSYGTASTGFRLLLQNEPLFQQVRRETLEEDDPEFVMGAIFDHMSSTEYTEQDLVDTLASAGIDRSEWDDYAKWRQQMAAYAEAEVNIAQIEAELAAQEDEVRPGAQSASTSSFLNKLVQSGITAPQSVKG